MDQMKLALFCCVTDCCDIPLVPIVLTAPLATTHSRLYWQPATDPRSSLEGGRISFNQLHRVYSPI